MSLHKFLSQSEVQPKEEPAVETTDNSAAVSGATPEPGKNPWDELRSRISRYYVQTKEYPEWCEEDETLAFVSCSMSGQVIHSKKDPSKVKFRVHRYFRVRGMEEMISDAVDFDKEEEAIDFMLQEKEDLDFRADENVIIMGHYFWSLKDGKPYKGYLGKIDGEWV